MINEPQNDYWKNLYKYTTGGRDNLNTTRSLMEDIFGTTTGNPQSGATGPFNPLAGMQDQMKSLQGQLGQYGKMMDFGKQFGSVQDMAGSLSKFTSGGFSGMAQGLGGLGKGAMSFAKGGLGAIGKAAMANPVGAALAVGTKIFQVAGKTKAAKAADKAFAGQQKEYKGAIDDARDLKDTQIDIVEEGRDIGLIRQGEKLSDQATAINEKEISSYEQTGGLVNLGDIDFSIHTAEENLQELAGVIEQDTTSQYQKGVAQADAQFESFQDEANRAIAELQKKRNSLKTKWYQNVA